MSRGKREKEVLKFRRRAIRYCVHFGLISSGLNQKNSALKRLVMDHSGAADDAALGRALESVKGKLSQRKPKAPISYPGPAPTERIADTDFFGSRRWKELRYLAIKQNGRKCLACGNGPHNGKGLHVDHIKPRIKYPALQWEIGNLQVLCEDCNIGKGIWDDTDWRTPELKAG